MTSDSTSSERGKQIRKAHAWPMLQSPRRVGWLRLAVIAACASLVLVYSIDALGGLKDLLALTMDRASASILLLVAVTLLYALCLAIPFVPGMEIGILMMLMFGRPGIAMAYLGTLLGLNLAYAAGRVLRHRMVDSDLLRDYRSRAVNQQNFGLRRICRSRWFGGIADRLAVSTHGSRDYLLVGVLLNVPGNVLIGGGGAISLIAGLSGRMKWAGFVLTVAFATMAVPLLVLLGWLKLEAVAAAATTGG